MVKALIKSAYYPEIIGTPMSLELLSKLEKKIQAALDTIELQKLELEEEKQKTIELTEKNEQLRQELNSWNDKVSGLVGLLNENEEVN